MKMYSLAYADSSSVNVVQDDFLGLPLDSDKFSSVDAVLLDPSCSGSGTAHTQLDRLLSPTGPSCTHDSSPGYGSP